jgi:hypothetical protein
VSAHIPTPTARSAPLVRASAARRLAIAAARRVAIGRARAAVRAQLATSLRQRQEVSFTLVCLRRSLREFRSDVRARLREIGREAISRRAGQKGPTANATPSD